jgi:hypothetical protein
VSSRRSRASALPGGRLTTFLRSVIACRFRPEGELSRQSFRLPRSDTLLGVVRGFTRNRAVRRWIVAWLGGSILGIVNGVARELAYKDRVGDSTANQISAVSLTAPLALYFVVLQRRWPLSTTPTALEVGGVWVFLTVLFEFGFGHYVDRKSWAELLDNYDITEGHLWLLVLLWIGVGPAATSKVAAP